MNLKKVIALLVSLVFVVSAFVTATSAVEYRVGGTKGDTAISESYDASVYHQYLKNINLTGDGRLDTVAIALSQIGYQEGNDDSQFAGTFAGSKNYTEFNRNVGDYGSGYGGDYAWCASFVSFALYQARTHNYSKYNDICRNHTNDGNYIWKEIGCQKWREQLDKFGYLKASASLGGNYVPTTGDLIFFGSKADHSSHIGLVVYCDGTNVYTVEGNTSQAAGLETNGGGVYFKSYELTSSRILGYGVLPYKTNSNAIRPDYTGKTFTTGIYINTNFENRGQVFKAYSDEACTKSGREIKTNTMFEITEFVSPTVAKVKYYTITNTAYAERTGYVNIETIKGIVVQAVSYGGTYVPEDNGGNDNGGNDNGGNNGGTTETPPVYDPNNTFVEITKGNGYVGHNVLDYLIDDESKGLTSKEFTLDIKSKLCLSGYAGFSQGIINSGYYFDNDTEHVYWNSNFLSVGDATATAACGDKAMNFTIKANLTKVSAGEHTVHFMLKLADGTFVIIDSLKFTSTETVEQPPVGGDDNGNNGEEQTTTTAPAPAPAPTSSGCGSTIGGISAIVVAFAASVAMFFKKKRK